MKIRVEHNFESGELVKALGGLAIGEGIEEEVIDLLEKAQKSEEGAEGKEIQEKHMKEILDGLFLVPGLCSGTGMQ